jgi:hypothetical protein
VEVEVQLEELIIIKRLRSLLPITKDFVQTRSSIHETPPFRCLELLLSPESCLELLLSPELSLKEISGYDEEPNFFLKRGFCFSSAFSSRLQASSELLLCLIF